MEFLRRCGSTPVVSDATLFSFQNKQYHKLPLNFRVGANRRVSVVRAFRDDDASAKKDFKETRTEIISNLNSNASEIADKIQAWWDASEQKPAIVAVGAGSVLALYFASTILNAIDRLPLLSTVFELVGLTYSGWTAYRFFLVEGEKEKLVNEIKGFVSKVGVDL